MLRSVHAPRWIRSAARCVVGSLVVIAVGVLPQLACATPALVDPRLASVHTVALVSLYARDDIVDQGAALPGVYVPAGLGGEVVDMITADVEGDLEARFGVGNVVPLRRAAKVDAVARLPAAAPPDEWSQLEGAVDVDIDAPDVAVRLGDAARAVGVDAVVVLRHEWWVSRVRYQRSIAVVGYDRCTLLVVDAGGHVVWRDSVLAQESSSQLFLVPGAPDFGTSISADEARMLARKTARRVWKDLVARERSARATR